MKKAVMSAVAVAAAETAAEHAEFDNESVVSTDPANSTCKFTKKNSLATVKKTAMLKSDNKQMKPIGHIDYPVTSFSLTIVKSGGDIQTCLLDIIGNFITDKCLRGAVSTEVGSRAHNLHLQGVIELHFPRAPTYVKILCKYIKDLLPDKKGHKVACKPFNTSQNFAAMVGYVFKDQDKPHFQTRYIGLF